MEFRLNTWYRIPKFNGYEVIVLTREYVHSYNRIYPITEAEDLFIVVKSFKNYKKYKDGYLLPYIHFDRFGNFRGKWYEMTDLWNRRKRLSAGQIIELVRSAEEDRTSNSFPNYGSRNKGTPWDEKNVVSVTEATYGYINRDIIIPEEKQRNLSVGSTLSKLVKPEPVDAITFY